MSTLDDPPPLTSLSDLGVPDDLRQCTLIDHDQYQLLVREDARHHHSISHVRKRARRHGFTIKTIGAGDFRAREEANAAVQGDAADGADESRMCKDAVQIFRDATRRGASDIHVYRRRDVAHVYYRIDNDLLHHHTWSIGYADRWIRTVYGTMCDPGSKDPDTNMDRMQSGAISRREYLVQGVYGLRVERNGDNDGHYMVIRLLRAGDAGHMHSVHEAMATLGYAEEHLDAIERMRQQPSGAIVLIGKVNSGKSTTLQYWMSADHAERPTVAMATLEDPVEYPIAGAVQVAVPTRMFQADGCTEEEARRRAVQACASSIVRSDMNVVMVGEMRDAFTTRYVVETARTGYELRTTTHANSAWAGIERMAQLLASGPDSVTRQEGIEEVAQYGVLVGLIYQRLVPLLCPHCRLPYRDHAEQLPDILRAQIEANPSLATYRERGFIRSRTGCEHCAGKGTSGRTVVAEAVYCTESLLDTVVREGPRPAERQWLREGGLSIYGHAVRKLTSGLIDPVSAREAVGPLEAEVYDAAATDRSHAAAPPAVAETT